MSQRKTLPRVEIRRQDDRPGSYPSILRTGDPTRKGNQPIYFDDLTTVVYDPTYLIPSGSSGSQPTGSISWPSTIGVGTALHQSTNFTSSIVTLGRTVKSSVGSINNLPIFSEAPGPFREHGLHEQIDTMADFYMTGTNIEHVGFGLQSRLKSKVAVRIRLRNVGPQTIPGNRASLYYWNALLPDSDNGILSVVANTAEGPATDNVSVTTTYPNMDAKMFGPFGNFLLSGSAVVPFYGVKPVSKIKSSLSDALQWQNNTASVLTDPRYAPSQNNLIRMDRYISHPFIIEKAVIEFPLRAGTGWFNDRTQMMPNGPFDNVPDAGGPCVTFALIGTNNSGKRDLIMSATVIPAGDDMSGTMNFVSGANTYRAMYGFRSFGRASVAIQPDLNGKFTGTIIVPGTANVRNSLISYGAPPQAGRQWGATEFKESYIGSIDPYGRGSTTDPCGRSIFGKEYTTPQISTFNIQSNNKKLFGSPPTNVSDYPEVWSFDSNVPSPYVIYPKDSLMLTLSKHRPVISVNGAYTSLGAPTGSHDFVVLEGNINITLFGSLLREGIESNDSHNPNGTSAAVHEIIGGDPIYDEYDVFYKDELRNTYITDYVSGSIFANNDAGRARWRSSLDSNATTRLTFADRVSDRRKFIYHLVSFRRYAEANSTTERFYDSLVPPLDEILRRGRYFTRLYAWLLFGTGPRNVITVNLDSNQYSSIYLDHSSNDWSRAFPFEPRYARVTRATTQKFFARFLLNFFSFYSYYGRYFNMNDNMVIKVGVGSNIHNIGIDQIDPGAQRIGLKNEVALKLLYGIGQFNNCYRAGAKTFGATDRPLMIENVFTNSYAGAEIRGWKYGLVNGLPQYTKALYRRDRYGQYRDMLEQRQDTKYFLTVDEAERTPLRSLFNRKNVNYAGTSVINVRFINTSGSLVRPEETYSSNLSFEATSSLPFFDGQVRNREEPLQFTNIQQFQYMG